RGEDLFVLARSRTFEEVAQFLWTGELRDVQPWEADPAALEAAARVQEALPEPTLPLDRLRVAMPVLAALDPLRYDTGERAVVVTGRRLVAAMVDGLPRRGEVVPALHVRPRHPFTGSMASRLWAGLTEARPPRGGLEALNAALVLVADHDLSVSTLAARMAASIAADPYAVVSVGLSALGGAMQAVASLAVQGLPFGLAGPDR